MTQLSNRGSIYLQVGSSTELVKQLRSMSSLAAGDSLFVFMGLFARKFEQIKPGYPLRTDCTDAFIADLISYGWIKLVSEAKG